LLKSILHIVSVLFLFFLNSCNSDKNIPTPPVVIDTFSFAKGADIGWLSQMEASGILFYNKNGVAGDGIEVLKNVGFNAIRLRVWVNPSSNWCGTNDVVAQAIRAKNKGMRIMIDFHYSDTWADPGNQSKPASWATMDFNTLVMTVANHTTLVMNSLIQNGVIPQWVQLGNETNNGMLWEEGKASLHMNNFAALINAANNAVKTVSPTSKTIVHLSNGWDNALYRWIFDGLKSNNTNWDIIGMSLYPSANDWQTNNVLCLANMNDMLTRYGKEIMVSEVGMPFDDSVACKSFLLDIINKTKSLPNHKGLGVFYWEPQCYNNWQGYTKGAFSNTGRPTTALDAFGN
jgi:arabinogalactan endo-1,4-beta-galactosidase